MINNFIQRIWQTRKYIQIRNVLGAHWIQPFSVVGHRTFGHKLQGDMILTNMYELNKSLYFDQSSSFSKSKLSLLFENLSKIDILFVKLNEVPFQKQSEREFNIFEVLAYCLFMRMKLKLKDITQDQLSQKQCMNQNLNFFFDHLDEIIDNLKTIELKRLQTSRNSNDLKNKQKIYLTNCSMQLARRQIRRRFIQLCQYGRRSSQTMYFMGVQIDIQFQIVAVVVRRLIIETLDHSKCYNFLQELDLKLKDLNVHSSVKEQIRSMYEDDIEKTYYTPLRNTQGRFMKNYGFDQYDSNGLIHTIPFIPTSVTKSMSHFIMNTFFYYFIKGQKYMGKSTNAVQIAILNNYLCKNSFLFIPVFAVDSIISSIHICTVQSFWRNFTREKFAKIQKQIKELKNAANRQTKVAKLMKTFFSIQTSQKVLSQKINKMYVDQFQSYIVKAEDDQAKIVRQLHRKLLKHLKGMYNNKVFCLSIAYQREHLKQLFEISDDDIIQGQIKQYFQKDQAKRLLISWLQICLSSAKFNNYKSINDSPTKLKQIEDKVIDYIKQLKTMNIETNSLEGQMTILKICAYVLLQKIINNPKTIFNSQQLKKAFKQAIIINFERLIIAWLNKVQKQKQVNPNKFKQLTYRKLLISYILQDHHFENFKYFYGESVRPELPEFLLNENKQLKIQLKSYAHIIWQRVYKQCKISYTTENEWNYQLYLLYKRKQSDPTGSAFGTLFHTNVGQALEIGTKMSENQLIKHIVTELLPSNMEKNLYIKQITLIHLHNSQIFSQIAQQSISDFKGTNEKQKLYAITLKAHFPVCDHMILKLQKRPLTDKIFASMIHIQVTVSQSKNVNEIREKIYVNANKEQEPYSLQFQRILKMHNAVLENYKTVILTGHKSEELKTKIQRMNEKNKLISKPQNLQSNQNKQKYNPFESYDVLSISNANRFPKIPTYLNYCHQIATVYHIYCQDKQTSVSNPFMYNKMKEMLQKFQKQEQDQKNKIVNQGQVLKLNKQMGKSETYSNGLQKQINQMQISLKKQQQLRIILAKQQQQRQQKRAKQEQQRQKKRAKQEQQKYKMIQQIFASLQKNQSQTGQIVKSGKLKEKAEQQRNEKQNSETAKKSNNNQNDK